MAQLARRFHLGVDLVSGSQGEFCAFEFPGCRGCKFSLHAIKTVRAREDPVRSLAWRGQIDQPMGSSGYISHATFHSREESYAVLKTALG